MTETAIPKDLPEWMDAKMSYTAQVGSPARTVTFVGERGIDRMEFLSCVRIVRDFVEGRKTFEYLLEEMKINKSHCQPDYGELARQVESWPRCTICGSPYIPSGNNKEGVCGNQVLHAKQSNANQVQSLPRCIHCSHIISPDPNSKRQMRSDKLYCSASCRTMESRRKKAHQEYDNYMLTHNSKGGLDDEF